MLQLDALRTANAPSTLFLGERKSAYEQGFSTCGPSYEALFTYSTASLDGTVSQQNMADIVCIEKLSLSTTFSENFSLRGPM
jgi:hypothetical protein